MKSYGVGLGDGCVGGEGRGVGGGGVWGARFSPAVEIET